MQRRTERIILVPGLGPAGAEMLPLSHHLHRRGYQTRLFWHFPWLGTLKSKAARLKDSVSAQSDADVIHFVGHSLGGVIVLKMLAGYVPENLGRTVTMGTPHMGSTAVHHVGQHPFGRCLVGRALLDACDAAPLALPDQCELGTLAGKRAVHTLAALLGHDKPNDTMVAEVEARHPSASDHVLLTTSHAGMLLSREVERQVAHFLSTGRFRQS